LCEEFREQELLDTITKLQYENNLPAHIAITDRQNTRISAFQNWKGKMFVPPTTHPSIRWSKEDPFLQWNHSNIE
ncbi:hypothetical protein L208DRAFT_1238573, partial [Tricholoma matsutake]